MAWPRRAMAAWLAVSVVIAWLPAEAQAACMAGRYDGGALATATVACSGSCSCPSPVAAQSGSITDGSGSYSNGADCSWVISSVGSSISISFSQFETESSSDRVVIYSCSSSDSATSCKSSSELASLSGSRISSSRSWTSTTGYMRVRFTSDSSVTYAGFVGNWNMNKCSLCPAGKPLSPPPSTRAHPSRVPCGDTRLHREELWVS